MIESPPQPAAPTSGRPGVRMAYWWATPGERLPSPDGANPLYHPLFTMLAAVRDGGSIKAAAIQLGRSYRHVWGELRRWETELGRDLAVKVQGQRTALTPFAERLLHIERATQARLAPQLDTVRRELERAFRTAFDD